MTKLLRVLKVCLEVEGADSLHAMVEKLMCENMLPSLSLVESGNPSLTEDVWRVLQLFSYQTRYRMYVRWLMAVSTRYSRRSTIGMEFGRTMR